MASASACRSIRLEAFYMGPPANKLEKLTCKVGTKILGLLPVQTLGGDLTSNFLTCTEENLSSLNVFGMDLQKPRNFKLDRTYRITVYYEEGQYTATLKKICFVDLLYDYALLAASLAEKKDALQTAEVMLTSHWHSVFSHQEYEELFSQGAKFDVSHLASKSDEIKEIMTVCAPKVQGFLEQEHTKAIGETIKLMELLFEGAEDNPDKLIENVQKLPQKDQANAYYALLSLFESEENKEAVQRINELIAQSKETSHGSTRN